MIKIFPSNAKDFSSNGLININPISCKETKKKSLNGWYVELEISSKYFEYIKKDMLVVLKSKSKLQPQAFRLDKPTYNNSIIQVTANHVMFDSETLMLYDVRPTDLGALNTLNYINERVDNISPFSFVSDVSGMNTCYFELKSMFEAWEIIEERFGGVFDADNFTIYFMNSLGHDVGQMLVYNKNLNQCIKYEDWSNVVTRIYPVGNDGLKLPEKYIDADITYNIPYTKRVDFSSELSFNDQENHNNELISELRLNAIKYLEENKIPKISYEISADINELYDVNDRIIVKHPLCDIKTEVQEYTYDHKRKMTENLVFGNYTRDVKQRFQDIKKTITLLNNSVSNNSKIIDEQSKIINMLNKTGIIYIDDNEILILDKTPKEEAKYVWRWGLGGMGFSSNGIEGPFATAWTQDGKFNADFISSGTINTSLIKGYTDALNKISEISIDVEKINTSIKDINSEAETISQINVSLNEIQEQLSSVTDITTSDKGIGKAELTGVLYSELLRLEIHPTKDDISYLYHSQDLYHSNDLYFLSRDVIFKGNNNETKFTLPCDLLIITNEENSVYDEFILNFDNQEMYCLHRIGINENGQKYILDNSYIEYFEYNPIILFGDNYEVKLLSFPDAYIYVRALASNIYTSQYITHYELDSSMNIMQRSILGTVSEKLTLVDGSIESLSGELEIQAAQVAMKLNSSDFTSQAIIGLINNRDGTSTALINANNINLQGYVTLTNLATSGQTTINGSNIKTGTIDAHLVNVTNLNADNITSGTISCNRLSGGIINGQTISGGTINGSHIICNSGKIGGANINGYGMYFDNENTGWGLWGTTTHANIVFHAGANTNNIGSAPFRIFHDGSVYSNKATISGTIYSSSGTIGGWDITNTSLRGYGGNDLYTVIKPTGIFIQNASGKDLLDARWTSVINTASDLRLKNNISKIDDKFEKFYDSLKPVTYFFNKEFSDNRKHIGFIAQDIIKSEKKIGEDLAIITKSLNNYYNLDKNELIALNTWQIQKLKNKIKNQNRKISDLEERLIEIEKIIKGVD